MQLTLNETIDISPEYLLTLSKQVDVLNKLSLLDKRGPLTQQFSRTLQQQFKELAQLLAMYQQDAIMRDAAIVRCKLALEFYVWERANGLIGGLPGGEDIAMTMQYLLQNVQNQTKSLERIIHRERMSRAEVLDAEKDKIIANLRRDLGVKRQYMLDLEERVREVQDENSKLYSKMISNAKNKVDFYTTSKSPLKQAGQYRSTSTEKASPRKKIITRSYEDEINEIIQNKRKVEGLHEHRSSMSDYLRTYFTMKYGKPLAQQNQASFRDTLAFLAKNQQKHIFVLFQAVLDQQCDEAFIQEQKMFLGQVIKCIKRYLNERYGRGHHQLEKMFQGRTLDDKNDFYLTEIDVETLLSNIYKSGEVRTLQMILSEMASSRVNDPSKLSCKRLINQLLDYQLKKHLMRVEDIVREIGRLPDRVDTLTTEEMQKVALRVIHDRERCQLLLRQLPEGRRWTVSEAIEVLERARHVRIRRES